MTRAEATAEALDATRVVVEALVLFRMARSARDAWDATVHLSAGALWIASLAGITAIESRRRWRS